MNNPQFEGVKALLFDLDGTLTNSGPGITRCVEHALKHFGIPVPGQDVLNRFVGPPLMESFSHFCHMSPEQCKEAVRVYRERYVPIGMFENELYPNVERTLEELRRRGYFLAVATSKPKHLAVKVLEYFDLQRRLDLIEGPTGEKESKADVIRNALAHISPGHPDEVIMIGDTIFDKRGAKETGLRFVACTYGYGLPEDLTGSDASVDAFDQLLELFPSRS